MSTSNWTDAIQMNKTLRLFAVFQEVVVTPWKGVGSDDLKNLSLVSLYDRLYLYPLLLRLVCLGMYFWLCQNILCQMIFLKDACWLIQGYSSGLA